MKKILVKYDGAILSRIDMKKVKGGYESLGGDACGVAACLGTNDDCKPAGCTTCSTSDGKTAGSCS